MADRRETHIWTDGETWHVYTERAHDLRRFERWFGPPTRAGRDGECAQWDLPGDALRIGRKVRSPSKPPSDFTCTARIQGASPLVSAKARDNSARKPPLPISVPRSGRSLSSTGGTPEASGREVFFPSASYAMSRSANNGRVRLPFGWRCSSREMDSTAKSGGPRAKAPAWNSARCSHR